MSEQKSKDKIIDERKANLPLPEQPGAEGDLKSADARYSNVGSGSISANTEGGLREPATGDSSVRTDGEEWKTNTADLRREGRKDVDGIPNDAVTRDKKDAPGLVDTTGKDYGYPQKSDPSKGA
ncbi:hypothetical protein EJ08DRAFT_649114, partial [Tothia fuscella]